MDLIKIPSGEITNKPLLNHISKKQKHYPFNRNVYNRRNWRCIKNTYIKCSIQKITLLHCNTEYPTPYSDVNLNAMNHLKHEFNIDIGYSDHTLGVEVAISAVALGARIIEKHFTVDKNSEGPDHLISLNEEELTQMIKSIRNIELSMGSKIKIVTDSERKNIIHVRKSIHTKRKIKSGDILTIKDLIMLRPGDGISPMEVDKVIGKVVKRDLKKGDKLKLIHLE